jgi:hypothetical protein
MPQRIPIGVDPFGRPSDGFSEIVGKIVVGADGQLYELDLDVNGRPQANVVLAGSPGQVFLADTQGNLYRIGVDSGGRITITKIALGAFPPLSYYVNLLTSQYQNSTNLIAWLSACLGIFIDVGLTLSTLPSEFDIEAAIGAQLDVVGLLVGVSRTLPFQPSGGESPILDDATYRLLIRAKTFKNQWDGLESSCTTSGTRSSRVV